MDDGFEAPSFIVYVYSTSTRRLIEHTLYQFERGTGPANQFGSHGFTGLNYVRAPGSRAELQYFCRYG